MFEKIQPLGDRVLVKRLEQEDMTPGGLVIPQAAREKTQMGEVVSVGKGRTTSEGKVLPVAVKSGDVIFFGKYSGTEAGEEYLIVKEDEILGIVEK